MLHPILFLIGSVRFSVDRTDAHRAVNILLKKGIIYRNFSFSEERAFFEVSLISAARTKKAFFEGGAELITESRKGAPALLYRYRSRYGIFLGILLFAAITLLSGTLIWDVRVVGNSTLDTDTVVEELRAVGLEVGTPIWKIDTPVMENILLMESDKIAWISINIVGNVAIAEIREAISEPPEDDLLYGDLVAERDGVIEWFEDTRGNTLVKIGDTVKKGDVLISGYYPQEEHVGERYTVAKGRVYARTERDFSVSVPLIYSKKEYTGRQRSEKYLILFKKEVKIFGNSRNLYENCDTINTVEYIELPFGVLLPFGLRTVTYSEYERVEARRSEESAVELALYTLRCKMSGEVPKGMLVKKQMSGVFGENEYILECRAEYIENIALVKGK